MSSPVTGCTGITHWYDGLTFEQVRERLISGYGVPNRHVPGGVIVLPDGYLDWLHSTHRAERLQHLASRTVPFVIRNTHHKEE